MLSSCTPSEVVRTLRYVFFGCFCYQSSCLLIYLGTGVFIQMLGHENNSKHVVLPRSTPYLDLVHGPPSVEPPWPPGIDNTRETELYCVLIHNIIRIILFCIVFVTQRGRIWRVLCIIRIILYYILIRIMYCLSLPGVPAAC